MTAIAIIRTGQGFVIAADGRMRLSDESRRTANPAILSKESEEAQKIFEISQPGISLGFVIRGTVAGSGFYLTDVCAKEIRAIASTSFSDCRAYLRELARRIGRTMNRAVNSGGFALTKNSEQPRILFVGYFSRSACFFEMQFSLSASGRLSWEVDPRDYGALFWGSAAVRRQMYDDNYRPIANSPFSQYTGNLSQSPSIDEAERMATGYVQACSSGEALRIDEAVCKFIGGRMHVARVTPQGFTWQIPPKNSPVR